MAFASGSARHELPHASSPAQLTGGLLRHERVRDPEKFQRAQPCVPRPLVVTPREVAAARVSPRNVRPLEAPRDDRDPSRVVGVVAQTWRQQVRELVRARPEAERVSAQDRHRVPGGGEVPALLFDHHLTDRPVRTLPSFLGSQHGITSRANAPAESLGNREPPAQSQLGCVGNPSSGARAWGYVAHASDSFIPFSVACEISLSCCSRPTTIPGAIP